MANVRMSHYVCDRCGNYWRAYRESEACPACDHTAVWEFPPDRERAARDHAEHIKRAAKSPLFRASR